MGRQYDPAQDLVRIPMQLERLAAPVEQFTMVLEKRGEEAGVLRMQWEHTAVWVDVRLQWCGPLGQLLPHHVGRMYPNRGSALPRRCRRNRVIFVFLEGTIPLQKLMSVAERNITGHA